MTPSALMTSYPPSNSTTSLNVTFSGAGSIASTYVKVFFGDDECVPLSKQCTGGVFHRALAQLASSVGRQQQHGDPKTRSLQPSRPVTKRSQRTEEDPKNKGDYDISGRHLTLSSASHSTRSEYSRAELLPLNFVKEVTSNPKILTLYRQHVDATKATATESGKPRKAEGAEEGCPPLDGDGASVADGSMSSRSTTRSKSRESRSSGKRPGSGTTSAALGSSASGAAGYLSSHQQHGVAQQLWTALRGNIPFFGALTMPEHTTMEPIVSLPVLGTPPCAPLPHQGAAAIGGEQPVKGGTPSLSMTTTNSISGATTATPISVTCSGSYVLLGCRERSRQRTMSGSLPRDEARSGATISKLNMSSIAGNGNKNITVTSGSSLTSATSSVVSNTAILDRLMQSAREASAVRLPLDAVFGSDGAPNCAMPPGYGGGNESGKTSTLTAGPNHRTPQPAAPLAPLPSHYLLQTKTNRIVTAPPPLPEDLVLGYGRPSLVTRRTASETAADAISTSNEATDPVRGAVGGTKLVPHQIDEGGKLHPLPPLPPSSGMASSAMSGNASRVSILPRKDVDGTNAGMGLSGKRSSSKTGNASNDANSIPHEWTERCEARAAEVPLSAAAVARLTPSSRFVVDLSSCSVLLASSMATTTQSPHSQRGGSSGRSPSKSAPQSVVVVRDPTIQSASKERPELTDVFDGLDVMWCGPNGEEAILQWIMDEYSILLKQKMSIAMGQWAAAAAQSRDGGLGAGDATPSVAKQSSNRNTRSASRQGASVRQNV